MDTWTPGTMLLHGQIYDYEGRSYRAKYSHLAQEAMAPPKAPDLFDTITPHSP